MKNIASCSEAVAIRVCHKGKCEKKERVIISIILTRELQEEEVTDFNENGIVVKITS